VGAANLNTYTTRFPSWGRVFSLAVITTSRAAPTVRVVRVYVYPADTSGCGSYRLIWVSRVLAGQGHDVHLVLPSERTGPAVGLTCMQDQNGNVVSVDSPPDADVMVFQRITLGQLAQAVPMLRAKGIAVVVDMDDDLTCIHPSNVAWLVMHPRQGYRGHSWQYSEAACRAATMVTVSTPALLRPYAPHGRGRVLPNCVPARYLTVGHVDADTFGWAGSLHSHPGDLEMLGGSVRRLVAEGHRFEVVGGPDGVGDVLGLDADPPASGVVPIDQWPHAVARLGVGVAPLAASKFNDAKSALKILEYSACGVPWVASPSPEYTRLHRRHGVGMLAARPKDWYRALTGLLGDAGRRADLSRAGRSMAARMTIEGNAWRWMDVWEEALRVQRQAAVSAFTRL
jgi:glycosyltransferase involved in cell wall biosynthesis